MQLKRGILTISIDFELIWGTQDLFGQTRFGEACAVERTLIGRLLDLFVEHDISATWCILGHLFLKECSPCEGRTHPEIVRPKHGWVQGDWFAHDPCSNEEDAPLHYGRSLVEKIRTCAVRQEIGCHTFSHTIFGDKGCSREAAESELRECSRLANEMDIEMRSFAFPRNQVGHLDVLRAFGYECYRGPEPCWHERPWVPSIVKRFGRLWEVLTIAAPPTVLPQMTPSGLWNIPGSMIYFPMNGVRRFIPMRWRTSRAAKGLRSAARKRQIFHLWFHPTNLSDEPDKMFKGLSFILQTASAMRSRGELDIRSMSEVVSEAHAGLSSQP